MIRWVRALLRWIAEPKPFWLCAFVVVASVGYVYLGGVSEAKIRITGLFLQLCGIVTVAWGLRETRKLFGYPGFLEHLVGWLKRFPKIKPRPVSIEGHLTAHLHLTGTAHAWQGCDSEAPIEKRLAVVEANLLDVNVRLVQVKQQLDQETGKITSELEKERHLRKEEDEETRRKLALSHTGGLSISVMGLVWLFCGLILSTASTEIAKWFN